MTNPQGRYPAALDSEPLDSAFDFAAEQTRRYVASGGRGEDRSPDGAPVLLLTTVGRKSGQARRNPVVYGRRGEDYVLVASKGGAPEHPAWYLNLVDESEVLLQVGEQRFHASARTAVDDERAQLFAQMLGVLPALNDYTASTDREIPIVVVTAHS